MRGLDLRFALFFIFNLFFICVDYFISKWIWPALILWAHCPTHSSCSYLHVFLYFKKGKNI